MADDEPFQFVAPTFNANLYNSTRKNFYSCDTWELLNLSPTEVADIPTRLSKEYGISPAALATSRDVEHPNRGQGNTRCRFKITKQTQYMISVANHHSWAKSCAITGIGCDNLITIGVDNDARMDKELLQTRLQGHLKNKQAEYCVVVIAGIISHPFTFDRWLT